MMAIKPKEKSENLRNEKRKRKDKSEEGG